MIQAIHADFNYKRRKVSENKNIFQKLQHIDDESKRREIFAQTLLEVKRKTVRNARNRKLSVFENGFDFVRDPLDPSVDFYDEKSVMNTYYPQIERLCKRLTGADTVVAYNHVVREEGKENVIGPHHLVHNDYTPSYKSRIMKMLNMKRIRSESEEQIIERFRDRGITIERLRSSRICVLNFWRSRSEYKLKKSPLAVCDARTVRESDLSPINLFQYNGKNLEDTPLEICLAHNSESHDWNYFPDMSKDEIIVIRTYDSSLHPYTPTLHSAFTDPTCPEDYPMRMSCEVRVLCVLPSMASRM